jgi:DNA-directed RNA polymerase subunit RPC12/RpoP
MNKCLLCGADLKELVQLKMGIMPRCITTGKQVNDLIYMKICPKCSMEQINKEQDRLIKEAKKRLTTTT